MTQPIYQEALNLSAVWASYFPAIPVATEYWRLMLDSYPSEIIVAAIKRCVRKKLALNGTFTLEHMLAYIESVCHQESA